MPRFFPALALATVLWPASALAFQWPWQEPPEPRVEYCRGFLATGLGSFPLEGLSRIQLWLAWNEVVKLSPGAVDTAAGQYVEGREFFNSMREAGNTRAIIDEVYRSCAVGTG